MEFKVEAKEGKARAGTISLSRGKIETPIFMPVGTQATVKGVNNETLNTTINAQIILANTYHLYLRPGMQILENAGGVHKFMNWEKPMLTDSGGYQVYSLSGQRKIKEEGVRFKSHIDGSNHLFTPENVIEIQRKIGADIIMAFDECTPYPCEKSYAEKSLSMTHRWLSRCKESFDKTSIPYGHSQTLLPIIQGSIYDDLRIQSCEHVLEGDWPGYAIGGLSVGEPHEDMYRIAQICCDLLPPEKPRYLMGVGTPENLLECISRGIDMFDCVLPTRNARHGLLYTAKGSINIKNAKWAEDFSPIDSEINCSFSNIHSKAYLRHLFQTKETLGPQIATIHNLSFFLWLVNTARNKIKKGIFEEWKTKMAKQVQNRI